MLVGLEEFFCLPPAGLSQRRVHTASLNNALQVQVGLAVPDEVYFFEAQFYANLQALKVGDKYEK